MSLAVPPERSSGDDRTDMGELTISVNPTAVELVSIMLDAGFDANAGGRGAPPLHYAIDNLRYNTGQSDSDKHHGIIIKEQAAIVSLLLDAGADPTAGNHVAGGGATNNKNYAIHRVAQRWFFGMLPVMDELLRGGPGRVILPDDYFGTADPLHEDGSPNEPVLDRFIGHRDFGKHWDSPYDSIRLAEYTRVIQKIIDLGGACVIESRGQAILDLCDLPKTPSP